MLGYPNPYFATELFEFLYLLVGRLWLGITGRLPLEELATDEVQILVLGGVAVSSAIVGTFLVLRKMTMLANALSHTILFGIVVAYIGTSGVSDGVQAGHIELNLGAMLGASLVMGVVTTVATDFFHRTLGLQEDASIGVVFTTFFALGVVLVTAFTRNAHIGAEVVMGNVDALHPDDLRLVLFVLVVNLGLVALFFKEYLITSFDSALARALGISVTFFNYLLMVQVSMTVVAAFRAVGVLMVLGFMTAPVLTARLWCDRLIALLSMACGIALITSVMGVALTRHILTVWGTAFSTGGVTICILLLIFSVSAVKAQITRTASVSS